MPNTPPPPSERRNWPSLGRARLADVAAKAGVSMATASRALNQPDLVTEATRQKVASAVEQLGYIRDLAAGNLASERTGQVAVVVPSFNTTAFMGTIQGVSDTLAPHGLQVVLGDTNLSGDNEAKLVASLLGRRADAMIFTDIVQSPAARAMLTTARIPLVETWSLTREPIDMNVGFDNCAAAFAATEHLIGIGRRRIGMICGRLQSNQRGRDRRQGFLNAAHLHELDASLFVELPYPFRWRDSEAALATLVDREPELDGLFCSGDTFAAAALFGAQRRGWMVPSRIAIIGLGDLEMNERTVPSLSSVAVPGYQIGKMAAEMVIRRLAGEDVVPHTVDVGFEISRRDSTGGCL
jgi:LacI family gluconate utilization system Gnt-I transcriptional repressor